MERPIEKLKQLQVDIDKERKDLMIECDMLQGNVNRMMVTESEEELLKQFAWAHRRLGELFWGNRSRIELERVNDNNND